MRGIRSSQNLMQQLKQLAAEMGQKITSIIGDAARGTLRGRSKSVTKRKINLPTSKGVLRPGVDLNNSAALSDLMDEYDSSR
jgi:hypothetical protein